MDFDHLDLANKLISKRINNQKSEINVREFESDYKKNQEYGYQIRKYKMLHEKGKRVVLNNVLVNHDGRFRLPGTHFIAHKCFSTAGFKTERNSAATPFSFTPAPSEQSLKDKKNASASNQKSASQKKKSKSKKRKFKRSKNKKLKSMYPTSTNAFYGEGVIKEFDQKNLGFSLYDPAFEGLRPDHSKKSERKNQSITKIGGFAALGGIVGGNQLGGGGGTTRRKHVNSHEGKRIKLKAMDAKNKGVVKEGGDNKKTNQIDEPQNQEEIIPEKEEIEDSSNVPKADQKVENEDGTPKDIKVEEENPNKGNTEVEKNEADKEGEEVKEEVVEESNDWTKDLQH